MTATGHAVMGTVLAAAIPNPLIGIPLAILSHIACDAFPHWDTGTNLKMNNPSSKKTKNRFVIESFIDLFLSLLIPFLITVFLFPSTNLLYVYVMVFAAQSLDWLTAPLLFLNWKFQPFTLFSNVQKSFDHRLDKPWGIILQVAILSAAIIFVKYLLS